MGASSFAEAFFRPFPETAEYTREKNSVSSARNINIRILTTDENGNTNVAEVTAGTVYIKELSAPAGYKVDKTVYSLKVEAGKTATLKVSDTPKVTDTLIELFKIAMETQKDNPQGNASLAGAEFTWKYYAGFYNKDLSPIHI